MFPTVPLLVPIISKTLITGGVMTLGGIASYITGDLIKDIIKENDEEEK